MAQNSILQGMLKNTIAKNKATIPVVPTKTKGTNNDIIFGGVPATTNPVVPTKSVTQLTPQVKVSNPITQPTSNVQLQENIYGTPKPTVATAQNPVREIGVPKPVVTPPATVQYDPSIYDQYNNYSKEDIQNWLDHATVLASQGQPLSTQDQLIARNFQRKLEEMNKPQEIVDPTKAMIDQTTADKEARRIALEAQANRLYTSEEERIRRYYEQRKQDTLAGAERTKQAGQSATSFSGFGRSTFNADQQTQIQREAEQALSIDQAEMQASLDKYKAQLEGATQEQLAQYDNRIAELQGKSLEFKQKQYDAINAYNAQTAQDMSTKLENLVTLAQQNIPQTPLTEEEKQQASAYASLIIGADGKVDTTLMKEIPPRLISEAVTQGAMMKQAIKPEQEKYGFVNVGDGVIARTNPNTGAVEYTRSGFAQNKAPETVKTDNGTFQYNTNTGKYDIPIDKVTGNGVPITDAIARAIEECKNGAQCGKFVNDVLENALPGVGRLVGDSFESKVKAINKIGVATGQGDIGAGSIFTYPVSGSNYGHIGIVTGVNDDGTINIMDYNYKGDEKQRERTNVRISEITGLGGKISVPIVRNENTNTGPLTDKQFTQSNQIITSFKSDPQVKAFEETFSQGLNLLSSLNDDSGPGDTASVYQFMKSLDPQSVVREGEFTLAANSAGVVSKLGNTFNKLATGEALTSEQRDAFGKLAKEYIRNKAKIYQTKYKDGIKRLEKQGIDTGVFPTNIADQIDQYLSNTQQNFTPAPQIDDEDIALFNKYMQHGTHTGTNTVGVEDY